MQMQYTYIIEAGMNVSDSEKNVTRSAITKPTTDVCKPLLQMQALHISH